MTDSRRKGKTGEQELVRLLREQLGDAVEIRRVSHMQAGADALCDVWLHPFDIEVKRHKRPTDALIREWWGQAVERCRPGMHPCLAYRGDSQMWRFVIHGANATLEYCITLYLDGFCDWFLDQVADQWEAEESAHLPEQYH